MAFKLSLTKRSDDQPAVAPVWHPNFRNFERLPDTKVVRTTFFVNTAAIVVAVSLLLWLGSREYNLYSLKEQIAATQKVIDANMRQSQEAIRLTKQFADEEKKLTEAVNFQWAAINPSELITVLGESLPKEIVLEFVESRVTETTATWTVLLKGSVAGTPDQASGVVSTYVDMLKAHPRLGKIFESIVLNNLSRGANPSFLAFDISMRAKVTSKPKK